MVEQGKRSHSKPLISVIIPVYGTEKFIAKCLNSILQQTYTNLEIICVNDCTKDNAVEIIESLAAKDPRISLISHTENMGLFQARLTGMKQAHGDYIAFVDSDDYIGIDWFRCLLERIYEEQAEMVMGNTINVDESGKKTYYNSYRKLNFARETLRGFSVCMHLVQQTGLCFAWHTVWNKLYKRELVMRCIPYFERIKRPLIMCEDIAYSSVFYSLADSLAFADVDAYFYYRHSEASTSLKQPREKIKKNLEDVGFVFDYALSVLQENQHANWDKLVKDFTAFQDRYFRIWSHTLRATGFGNDREMIKTLCNGFHREDLGEAEEHEFWISEVCTEWSERLEYCKRLIASPDTSVISFDVFDTLVVRPFYAPTDIFFFVGNELLKEGLVSNIQTFHDMRIQAENLARWQLSLKDPFFEDVTLSEIYDVLAEQLHLDESQIHRMQQCEEELELQFCEARHTARELYRMARECGKKVVITSDMYLSKAVIEKILKKNGYEGYDAILVSSEERRLKATGSLFSVLKKKYANEKPRTILHIGDTWNTDVIAAEKAGLKTCFFPKAREVFENIISDIYVGDLAAAYTKNLDLPVDNKKLGQQLSFRCMIAVAANKLFDNPFTQFSYDTDYNSDSYLMGYYTFGMHILALAKWIYEVSREKGYETIHFFARDGLLVKQVFDFLGEKSGRPIPSDYVYATRKALLPYLIRRPEDFYDIYQYMKFEEHTPRDVLDIFAPVLLPLDSQKEEEYFSAGILLDRRMRNMNEFCSFIKAMLRISCDKKLLNSGDSEICRAIANLFGEHDAVFDIGYSGRLQQIVCEISQKKIDVFYLHHDGQFAPLRAQQTGFEIHSFYPFSPKFSGIIREFFISDPGPSCCGYKINDGKLEYVLEDKAPSYSEKFALLEFQRGAYDFCRDFITKFCNHFDLLEIRSVDASMPLKHFLLNAKKCDRYAFINAKVDDFVFSGYETKNLFAIWEWHLKQISKPQPQIIDASPVPILSPVQSDGVNGHDRYPFLNGKSKIYKAFFYFLFDRELFVKKFKFWRKVRQCQGL